jgi:hypothetical protein
MAEVQEGEDTVVVVHVPEGYEDRLREAARLAGPFRTGSLQSEELRIQFWQVKASPK